MTNRMFGIMLALLLLTTAAWAQQKGAIELITKAEVDVTETSEQGKQVTKRVDASKANVVPGDTVIYTIYYTNNGDKPATNVVIQDKVPEHMVYVEGSATGNGAQVEFSTDHGKNYGASDALTITDLQGNRRKAGAADYTDIRWTVAKLAAGAKGSVTFNARVK